MAGLSKEPEAPFTPYWLLAEITYKCPLQCPYCSNPVDFIEHVRDELSTEEWLRVFREARQMGAVQLGFSGGEPLLRPDLEEMVREAHKLGFYTNLITSTMGMDHQRLLALKKAGLDHIQVSFQASSKELNDFLAGTDAYAHKVEIMKAVKAEGFPVVFNIVIHRHNIDQMEEILKMAIDLGADHIELANTQYYGFAYANRRELMPSKEQVEWAEKIAHGYQERYRGKKDIFFVVPDYYANRPKPCMGGWGRLFITVTPMGLVLPCHSARVIPDLEFPNIRDHSLEWIWKDSPVFNRFRGYDWMKEPCRTCPERFQDFGGCRCQAYMLLGDAALTDPVCDLSPNHHLILEAQRDVNQEELEERFLLFRNPHNSRMLSQHKTPPSPPLRF